jgi:hypothetical protein
MHMVIQIKLFQSFLSKVLEKGENIPHLKNIILAHQIWIYPIHYTGTDLKKLKICFLNEN